MPRYGYGGAKLVGVLAVAVALLASCALFQGEPYSSLYVVSVGADLTVRSVPCHGERLDLFDVSVYEARTYFTDDSSAQHHPLWSAHGDQPVKELVLGREPAGWTGTPRAAPVLQPGLEYVVVVNDSESMDAIGGSVSFQANRLSGDRAATGTGLATEEEILAMDPKDFGCY